jgi:hypothetical protein
VPAYQPCTAPNRQHGAPLAVDSCSPPRQVSSELTVGTLDANGQAANSVGSVRYDVMPGDETTPADEADVAIAVSLTDVRKASDLSDYTGELRADASVRLTDRLNGPGANEPGTTEDFQFPVTVPCAATPAGGIGGTCSVSTTFDAVMPGSAPEGKRANWQLGTIEVFDGGPDGLASTASGDALFADQGVFTP